MPNVARQINLDKKSPTKKYLPTCSPWQKCILLASCNYPIGIPNYFSEWWKLRTNFPMTSVTPHKVIASFMQDPSVLDDVPEYPTMKSSMPNNVTIRHAMKFRRSKAGWMRSYRICGTFYGMKYCTMFVILFASFCWGNTIRTHICSRECFHYTRREIFSYQKHGGLSQSWLPCRGLYLS